MATISASNTKIDTKALEGSLPALTRKLKELNADLSPDEQAVFSSIINSAAMHLQTIQALGDEATIQFDKPISAVASVGVRKHLLDLPQQLGLNKA